MVSRQRAALAVAAVALVVLAAGAYLVLDRSGDASPADDVPADADYVGHLNAAELRSQNESATATRRALRFQSTASVYHGPRFHASFAFREDGPDGAVRSVTYFGRHDRHYAARIVTADWDPERAPDAIARAENVSLDRRDLAGQPAHVGDGLAVAALDDGRFVVGATPAVRDALRVASGDAEALSGPLRARFRATGGHARFAYRFRAETVPEYPFVGESVRRIAYVDGGYRRNGSRLQATANLTVENADAAGNVAGVLDAGLTFYRFESSNASLKAELRRIQVAAEGRVVRVTYESDPANYRVLIRGLARNQPESQDRLDDPGVDDRRDATHRARPSA